MNETDKYLPQPDLGKLQFQLAEIVHFPSSNDHLLAFLSYSVSLINGSAIALMEYADGALVVRQKLLSKQAVSLTPSLEERMLEVAEDALGKHRAVISSVGDSGAQIVAIPFCKQDGDDGCLTTVLMMADESPETFVVILQLLSSILSLWLFEQNKACVTEERRESTPVLTHLFSALFTKDETAGLSILSGFAAKSFSTTRVILGGLTKNNTMQISSYSSIIGLNKQSSTVKMIQQVLDECRILNNTLTSDAENQIGIVSPIVKQLSKVLDAQSIVALPLRNEHQGIIGCLVILYDKLIPPKTLQERLVSFDSYQPVYTAILQKLIAPKPPLVDLTWYTQLSLKKRLISGVAVLSIFTILFLIPFPFKVKGACVIQPKNTRTLVAHFDSIVEQVILKSGTQVKQGDLIATLDGRQIALEITTLEAEIKKNKKMQDVYLATSQTASAQMSRLEVRRLQGQLNLLIDRNNQLDITSPIDGVIIQSNIEDSEGRPVSKGQILTEVAPLAKLVANIYIKQEDISFLEQSQSTTIALDSYPGKQWAGKIDIIQPKAEIRDNHHIFLVKSEIENDEDLLRPGMRGDSKIVVGSKPLWWICLRTPWNYFQKLLNN